MNKHIIDYLIKLDAKTLENILKEFYCSLTGHNESELRLVVASYKTIIISLVYVSPTNFNRPALKLEYNGYRQICSGFGEFNGAMEDLDDKDVQSLLSFIRKHKIEALV